MTSTLRRALLTLALVGSVGFSSAMVTGCQDTAAIQAALTTATGQVGELSAKVATVASSVDTATAALDAMPAGTPGVDELKAKLAEFKTTLDAVKTSAEGYGPKLAEAGAQSPEAIAKVAEMVTADLAKLGELETGLAEVNTKIEEVKKAAEAAAAGFEKPLSTGFVVKGKADGLEAQMVAFLEDAAKTVDTATAIPVDGVMFAGADIDVAASKPQMDNLNEILKAFPAAKIKVAGPQAHAEAVVKALTGMGVAADRVVAEAMGDALTMTVTAK